MEIGRRKLLWGMAALAAPLPGLVQAQDKLLPLQTPGLDHLDVIVPDVEATTRFYMGLLKTNLHAQPFRGGFRYFVLLGDMNDKREVGYLAIGASNGRGSYIGHFCTSVQDWRENSQAIFAGMGDRFAAGGFGEFPGSTGFGGLFNDPDGIEIQFLPAPDTLVTAAVPSDLVPSQQGIVKPHGVDHVLLRVSDLDRALAWYGVLYGWPQWNADRSRAWFDFPASDTRIYLEEASYKYGQDIGIVHFGIKVDAFDRAAVSRKVAELGGEVLDSADEAGNLRIRDPDGNVLELVSI